MASLRRVSPSLGEGVGAFSRRYCFPAFWDLKNCSYRDFFRFVSEGSPAHMNVVLNQAGGKTTVQSRTRFGQTTHQRNPTDRRSFVASLHSGTRNRESPLRSLSPFLLKDQCQQPALVALPVPLPGTTPHLAQQQRPTHLHLGRFGQVQQVFYRNM